MNQENDLRNTIYRFLNDIWYLNQMQAVAMNLYEKNYYSNQITKQTETLIEYINKSFCMAQEVSPALNTQKEFTIEELAYYNGSEGKAAYVAVNGIVYDMSKEITWGGGTHFGLYSGKDLTAQFMGCHKGMVENLEKLPKVGILK